MRVFFMVGFLAGWDSCSSGKDEGGGFATGETITGSQVVTGDGDDQDGGSDGSGGSGSSGGSDGSGGDGGEGGSDAGSAGGSAPVIIDVAAYFEELPLIGDVISVHIWYTDADDDVMEGASTLNLSYSSSSDNVSESFPIDGELVLLEEGNELSLAFDGVDTSDTYVFVVSIVDQAGNVSEEWTQNCVPSDD